VGKKRMLVVGGWLVMLAGLAVSVMGKHYGAAMGIVMLGFILCVFQYFERGAIVLEKIVLVSLLSALSSVGRVIFAGLPSVQPSSFMIIMAGGAFGPEVGLMTGIVTAVASNLVLGQGPWTPWQMFLWGGMGFLSGVFRRVLMRNRWLLVGYGLLWGFIFGWGMNLWYMVGYAAEANVLFFVAACFSSFPFDLAHGVSNALLLLVAAGPMLTVFRRLAVKYDIH